MFERLINWWNSQYEICEGCNQPIKGGIFSYFVHHSNHIDGVLGYNINEETFSPSTRVYFLKEKQRRGL